MPGSGTTKHTVVCGGRQQKHKRAKKPVTPDDIRAGEKRVQKRRKKKGYR